jgi:hypothetical protein
MEVNTNKYVNKNYSAFIGKNSAKYQDIRCIDLIVDIVIISL